MSVTATKEPQDGVSLLEVLRVEPVSDSQSLGGAPAHVTNNRGMVFGGVLLGQAVAAARAPAGRPLHMLSANFHRGAALDAPVEYDVCEPRDGGSFSSRRIVASQGGRTLAEFCASYQAPEEGLSFEEPWTPPPPPEALATLAELTAAMTHLPLATRRAFDRTRGLDIRPLNVEAITERQTDEPIRFWVRVAEPLEHRRELWAPSLAFMSDFLMAGPGVARHTFVHDPAFFGTTLNHTLWLHRDVDPSQWLFNEISSPWTGGGRTLNLGRMFTRDGQRVATNAQEALFRRRLARIDG